MVTETAPEATSLEEQQNGLDPVIDPASDLPAGTPGPDAETPSEGTASAPAATGTEDTGLKLEDLPTWKSLFGEQAQAVEPVESQADVAYRQRQRDLADGRRQGYRSQLEAAASEAEAEGREQGLDGAELDSFVARRTNRLQALHSNADAYFGNVIHAEVMRYLPEGARQRYAEREYWNTDGIGTLIGDALADVVAYRDSQYAALINQGRLFTKETVAQLVKDAEAAAELKYVKARGGLEASNNGASSGEHLGGGPTNNAAPITLDEALNLPVAELRRRQQAAG